MLLRLLRCPSRPVRAGSVLHTFFVSGPNSMPRRPTRGVSDGVAWSDRTAWSCLRARIGPGCIDGTANAVARTAARTASGSRPPEVSPPGRRGCAPRSTADRLWPWTRRARERALACRRVEAQIRLPACRDGRALARCLRVRRHVRGQASPRGGLWEASGSPVLRRVVHSFGTSRVRQAVRSASGGAARIDASGVGSSACRRDLRHARLSVESISRAACQGERLSARCRRKRARACAHPRATRTNDRGGSSTRRRGIGHMILRSGRTVKPLSAIRRLEVTRLAGCGALGAAAAEMGAASALRRRRALPALLDPCCARAARRARSPP